MKSRLLNVGLIACALLMTLSGCSTDETLTDDNGNAAKSMKINVSDGNFTSVDNSGAKTRATDTESGTSFTKGDAIGVFVVKKDGTLALTNAKYTYDGSKWLNSESSDKLPCYEGARYFAYYPYQESMMGKYDATKTTATDFFATLISGWTPATDQSTQALYTAQDLMVSMATVGTDYSCTFAMAHQMSMIEMDLHQAHYTYNGADTYRFTFNTYKPFNVAAGKYRLLFKPSASVSIVGDNQYNSTDNTKTKKWHITATAPATASTYKVYKYNKANAWLTETARQNVYIGDANIGDYLYSDGTTGSTVPDVSSDKKIAGIIFSDQISAEEYTDNFTHGHALALNDASTSELLYKTEASESGLTKVQNSDAPYNDIIAGYYGTFTLKYDKSKASYPAWQAANSYNVDVTGFTNSGWYLPSIGQWIDVCANLGKVSLSTYWGDIYKGSTATTNVNDAIKAAGGTALNTYSIYWSASEYESPYAVHMDFSSSYVSVGVGGKADNHLCVRAVLAY